MDPYQKQLLILATLLDLREQFRNLRFVVGNLNRQNQRSGPVVSEIFKFSDDPRPERQGEMITTIILTNLNRGLHPDLQLKDLGGAKLEALADNGMRYPGILQAGDNRPNAMPLGAIFEGIPVGTRIRGIEIYVRHALFPDPPGTILW